MVKKSLCLAGRVLNLVLAGAVLVWVAAFGYAPNTMGVLIYFFKDVKMEQFEFVRFTVLPILSLAHLAFGAGSYLAYEYFRNYA